MKKLIVFILALGILASYAAADDEPIGISAGLEFGVSNVNEANGGDMWPYIMPMLIYDNSFLDGGLDVYAEADYTFGIIKEPDENVNWQSLYVDLMLGYNLSLGSASDLSFILENEFDEIVISPNYEGENSLTGIFTPAVKFKQGLDIGSLSAKIGVPVTYVQYSKDADTAIWLDLTLGWKSNFGMGIQARICNLLSPSDNAGYLGLETIVSYETEPLYFQIKILIPKENDGVIITPRYGDLFGKGVIITPRFEYSFKDFIFYVKSKFTDIGVDGRNVSISPALGFTYSF